jgi:hypothetical protein
MRYNAFGATVQFWWHRLIEWCDLSDFHKMPSMSLCRRSRGDLWSWGDLPGYDDLIAITTVPAI